MDTPALSARNCIRFGWETFKRRPWFIVRAGLLLFIIQMVLSIPDQVPEEVPFEVSVVILLLSIAAFFTSFLVEIGATNLMLRIHDTIDTAELSDLWRPEAYWRYLGAIILVVIIVLVGLILLIVPGIIAAIALSFVGFLVIDKGLRPVAALKESARLTKGYRWHLFRLAILSVLVNILGALLLLVGLFVTVPVSVLAWVHAYRVISAARPVPAPESLPATL